MIKIYTISSCTSCKKAKTWLNNHQLPYKEQNLGKEPLTKEEILNILSKTENGVESIVSSKNRYAKALNCDIDELSVSEVIDLIQENPRILKSPILIDDKRLQVGYKEDDIRAFLPRSIVGSVVKFGMFVELPNTIEGLVHITTLPEFYNYNERTMTLQGEKTGKTFRVGQPIRVKLTRADKETGDIDFQYLPSEYDVTEKVDHKARQEREEKAKAFRNRGPRRDRQNGDFERRGKRGDNRNHQDANGRKGSYDEKRKSSKKPDKRKNQNRPHNDNKGRESGRRKKKGNKPFYKDVAKKRK